MRLEPLERRELLSITVDTLFDESDGSIVDGDISLRDAIALAPAGETIDFAAALTSGGPATINLSLGTIFINKDLAIVGPGAGLLTIDASTNDPTPFDQGGDGIRIFSINDATASLKSVSLSGLTVTGADASGDGGAFLNRESLNLTDVAILNSAASGRGGAIANANGTVVLTSSTISGNWAGTFGGGISNRYGAVTVTASTISGNQAGQEGGGLDAFGANATLTLMDSMVNDNSAGNFGGGVNLRNSTLHVLGSTLQGNQAGYEGGGIFNRDGNVTLTGSGISGNHSSYNGGGIVNMGRLSVSTSSISDNSSTDGRGGGIFNSGYVSGGQVTISGSTISGNSAGSSGGGISHSWYNSTLIVEESTISGNSSTFGSGGGIYGSYRANVVVNGSTISGNAASFGGGVYTWYSNLTVNESTISGNTSSGGGAGIHSRGYGRTVSVTNSTISFNSSEERYGSGGGGIYAGAVRLNVIGSTIVSNSTSGTGGGISSQYLTMTDSTVSGNTADREGGGIILRYGTGNITRSLISGNVTGLEGGGIFNRYGNLSIAESYISGNSASAAGGGINQRYGYLTLRGTTVGQNFATSQGGGMRLRGTNLDMANSTISGNSTGGSGGGMYLFNTSYNDIRIRHSTIAFNDAGTFGGGIGSIGGNFDLDHTIVANNGAQFAPDLTNLFGGIAARFSLIGDNAGSSLVSTPTFVPDANGNLIGPAISSEPLVVYIDMAAMGDFEAGPNGDSFLFEYSIDGGPFQPLFTSSVDESISHTYYMDRGTQVVRDDPLLMNGVVLDKYFQQLMAIIPESGSELRLRFTATNDGPTEAFAWRNLYIYGQNTGRFIGSGVSYDASGDVYKSFSADPDYSVSGDMFGIRSRLSPGSPSLPSDILDDSISIFTNDIQGIVSEYDQGRFFGVVDTVNGVGSNTNSAIGTFEIPLAPIDPSLAPLVGNGGPLLPNGTRLPSHALLAHSVAIDAGNPAAVAGIGTVPLFDARGRAPFARVKDGDGTGGPRIDIGAVEYQSLHLVVDTLADEDDGDFSAGDLSLREAIGLANDNVAEDTIDFAPALAGGTILLTMGELNITDSVTINGLGADLLTVDASGNDPTPSENLGDGSAVINAQYGGNIEINGLTITGGDTFSGGGIRSYGNLTVRHSTITGNASRFGPGGGIRSYFGNLEVVDSTVSGNYSGYTGGGISSRYGSLKLLNSIVTGNQAASNGGGIESRGGSLEVVNSLINYNVATDGYGGGISNRYGNLTVTGSLISGNSSGNDGGGIFQRSGELSVTGSSIRGNFSDGSGGGIASEYGGFRLFGSSIFANAADQNGGGVSISSYGGNAAIVNSTISNNSADFGGGVDWFGNDFSQLSIRSSTVADNFARIGGGVFAIGAVELANSIVARNYGQSIGDITGVVGFTLDAHYSLIGDGRGSGLTEAPLGAPSAQGNLVGGPNFGSIDPLISGPDFIGPMLPDGSQMTVYTLLSGSPAVDAGDPAAVAGVGGVPEFDQRGAPYARVSDGDGDGTVRIDMGATEAQSLTFVVDTLADDYDDDYSPGHFSLREAIELANNNQGGADRILFDNTLAGGTIVLSAGPLFIYDSVKILGLGAELLTIDGSGNDPTPNSNNFDGSPVFEIYSYYGPADVEIQGLTITGGDTYAGGGIVSYYGHLTLVESKVTGNSAYYGGGVYSSPGGSLTLDRSTISNNRAQYQGGGIQSIYSPLTITASTISGNTSTSGAGLYIRTGNYYYAEIVGSTISGNSASYRGGGIYNLPYSNLTIRHTTITSNSATNNGGGIMASGNESLNHSIVAGNTRGSRVRNDITGSATLSFTLLGVNTSTTITNSGGNLIGTSATPREAMLGPLANNGGPTFTHALLPGSPAIDAGSPTSVPGVGTVPLYDQRNSPFTRMFGLQIDLGAYEAQPLLLGDFDNSGTVDNADLTLLLNNWSQLSSPTPAGWSGVPPTGPAVDSDELTLLLNNWGKQSGGGASQALSVESQELLVGIAVAQVENVTLESHAIAVDGAISDEGSSAWIAEPTFARTKYSRPLPLPEIMPSPATVTSARGGELLLATSAAPTADENSDEGLTVLEVHPYRPSNRAALDAAFESIESRGEAT